MSFQGNHNIISVEKDSSEIQSMNLLKCFCQEKEGSWLNLFLMGKCEWDWFL